MDYSFVIPAVIQAARDIYLDGSAKGQQSHQGWSLGGTGAREPCS